MTAAWSASPTTAAATGIAQSARVWRAQWLADRQADLLPVPYFHVVFTVPAPIAAIALQNKAVVGEGRSPVGALKRTLRLNPPLGAATGKPTHRAARPPSLRDPPAEQSGRQRYAAAACPNCS